MESKLRIGEDLRQAGAISVDRHYLVSPQGATGSQPMRPTRRSSDLLPLPFALATTSSSVTGFGSFDLTSQARRRMKAIRVPSGE